MCPIIWPVLVNVPCVIANQYHAVIELNMLQILAWLIVWYKSSVSLLVFYILILSVTGKKAIEISKYYCGFFYLSFQFCYLFALCIWKFYSVHKCLENFMSS